MTRLLLIGVSHKTAPIALREQLAMTAKQATRFGSSLVDGAIEEAVVLSTCNRTEVYAATTTDEARALLTEIAAKMAHHAGVDGAELARVAYTRTGADVERHLYGVTAGLDSMVLGESEVQGQVKRALESALAAGTTGPLTSRLFSTALKAGKRVRSETAIGKARTSIASVAVDLAFDAVGALDQRAVMMIGTGETGALTARALTARGARTVFIANRRVEHAHALAEQFSGSVATLDDLERQIEIADVLVSATASPHTVVQAPALRAIMKRRETRPLVLIDLALPRDIDPDCHEINGVTMIDLEDLQGVIDATFVARDGERAAAEQILGQEVERFELWLAARRDRASEPEGQLLELFGADSGKDRRTGSA